MQNYFFSSIQDEMRIKKLTEMRKTGKVNRIIKPWTFLYNYQITFVLRKMYYLV